MYRLWSLLLFWTQKDGIANFTLSNVHNPFLRQNFTQKPLFQQAKLIPQLQQPSTLRALRRALFTDQSRGSRKIKATCKRHPLSYGLILRRFMRIKWPAKYLQYRQQRDQDHTTRVFLHLHLPLTDTHKLGCFYLSTGLDFISRED